MNTYFIESIAAFCIIQVHSSLMSKKHSVLGNNTVRYFREIIVGSCELSKKEKEILLRRLSAFTLETIAKKYNVTAERIRQIEEAAIKKFRSKICQLILLES